MKKTFEKKKFIIFLIIIIAIILYSFNLRKSDLNIPRFDHTATLLQDGRVLVTGGTTIIKDGTKSKKIILDSAEIFNPKTNKFIKIKNMNRKRSSHSAVLLQNGNVLILGGEKESKSAEIFDPKTDLFEFIGNTKIPHFKASAVLLKDGKVLISGGSTLSSEGGKTNTLITEIYNPKTNSFSYSDKLKSQPSEFNNGVLLPNGDVLLSLGYINLQDLQNGVNTYNLFNLYLINNNKFKTIAQIKPNYSNRCIYSQIAYYKGNIFNFCTGVYPHRIFVETLNDKDYLIKKTTNKLKAIFEYVLLQLDSENILLIGGNYGGMEQKPNGLIYDYNLNTNAFSQINKYIKPRYRHTATILQNGNILIIGGIHKNLLGFTSIIKKTEVLNIEKELKNGN